MAVPIRKRLMVALTAMPYVYILVVLTYQRMSPAAFAFSQSLAPIGFLLTLVPLIFWTFHIGFDARLTSGERALWWAVVWLGGVVGQVVYIALRVWPDKPFVVSVSQPGSEAPKEVPPDSADTFDSWK